MAQMVPGGGRGGGTNPQTGPGQMTPGVRGVGPRPPPAANTQSPAPVAAPPRAPAPGAGAANLPVAVQRLFFTNVSEIRESMMQYVSSTDKVTLVPVPGNATVSYLKRSPRSRWTSASLIIWFTDLHDLGYCLEGAFNENNFGINQLGFLRGHMSLISLVKKISATVAQNGVDGVGRNMAVVANIIQHHINSGSQIPHDLSHLLSGLRQYKIKYAPLVRRHVSNDHEDFKTATFLKMHMRLKYLQKMNPTKHTNIVQSIQGKFGPPNLGVWLDNAMLNFHVHDILRHKSNRNNTTLFDVVYGFLASKVQAQYVRDDAIGLITCRRNGQSHMESDCSVDTLGYLEAALFGALEALTMYHQIDYKHELARGAQSPQSVATRLLNPIDLVVATTVAHALDQFLTGCQLSLATAKVGVAAAVKFLLHHQDIFAMPLSSVLANDAVQEAYQAVQGVQGGGVAQAGPPIQMYTSDDVDHMYHSINPRMLAIFQMAMFNEQECFHLGEEDKKVIQLT